MLSIRYAAAAAALAVTLCATVPAASAAPFGAGLFIMNEELSGNPRNGSVNFFDPVGEGSWSYRVYSQANDGLEIPGAICHAQLNGGKLYIISNHPIAVGSYNMTGTLTIADAATLRFIASHELVNIHQKPVLGRASMTIADGTTLVTTNDGVLRYNPADDTLTPTDILTSPDGIAAPYPYQYPYQTGSMTSCGNRIFIASQSEGLIELTLQPDGTLAKELKSVATLLGGTLPDGITADAGIGSVVTGNDGNLWMSLTADRVASGTPLPFLLKYSYTEGKAEVITVPDGIYPPANSWYAWTPDGFHASAHDNTLCWNGGESTWFSNSAIFRYDIDNATFTKVADLAAEPVVDGALPWMIYGCSMRTSPVSGDLYVSLFKDYGSTDYTLRRITPAGEVTEYPMQPAVWFPSLPVFNDLEAPVFTSRAAYTLETSKTSAINLLGFATDPDSPDAEICYTVAATSDPALFDATVDGNILHITHNGPDLPADGWVELKATSQGIPAATNGRISLSFAQAGVESAEADHVATPIELCGDIVTLRCNTPATACIYSTDGRLLLTLEAPCGESAHDLSSLPAGIMTIRLGAATLKFSR